jgi:hypothetical protein
MLCRKSLSWGCAGFFRDEGIFNSNWLPAKHAEDTEGFRLRRMAILRAACGGFCGTREEPLMKWGPLKTAFFQSMVLGKTLHG